MGVAHERQKRNYDRNTSVREYPVGSWVWYFYPPDAKKKLRNGWTGPYLVINNELLRAIKIQREPNLPSKIVHIDSLKKLEGPPPREAWVAAPAADIRPEPPADANLDPQPEEDQPDADGDPLPDPEPMEQDPEETAETGPPRRSERHRTRTTRLIESNCLHVAPPGAGTAPPTTTPPTATTTQVAQFHSLCGEMGYALTPLARRTAPGQPTIAEQDSTEGHQKKRGKRKNSPRRRESTTSTPPEVTYTRQRRRPHTRRPKFPRT